MTKSNQMILPIIFLMTGLFYPSLGQVDSSRLPIIVIQTYSQIKDEPKVSGSLLIYDGHPSGYNKLTHTPCLIHKIGIEYRGQTSQRLYPKKGFGFEFRDAEDQEKAVEVLNMPAASDWVIHSPYGDKTLMRNALIYEMASDLFDYAPRTRFCELVLNGEYYGVTVLTESLRLGKNHVDIQSATPQLIDGGYLLKFDKGEDNEVAFVSSHSPVVNSPVRSKILFHDPKADNISKAQTQYIRSYLFQFEDLFTHDDLYGTPEYHNWIDIKSFVRYMLLTELTRNVDGYRISTYFYKTPASQGENLVAGPVWDYNIALGNADYCGGQNVEGWAWDFNKRCPDDSHLVHFWWRRFLQDPVFTEELAKTYKHLRDEEWEDEEIEELISSFYEILEEPQKRNFDKWKILGKKVWPNHFVGRSYQEEVDYLTDWIDRRLDWMDENIDSIAYSPDRSDVVSYRIYPNPAYDIVNLDLTTAHPASVSVRIYDLLGRLVLTKSSSSNLSHDHHLSLTSSELQGTYMLELTVNESHVASDKIVILPR
ncbi:MAG: CotH kinase family protein [Saprospiraceae bacterium]|nr:CotH kinase family protein [Saprospiraceae bacterium]